MKSEEYRTVWGRVEPYALQEIADVIPFGWKAPEVAQTGVGRNCDLFASLMKWAGRECNAGIDVYTAACAANQDFTHPLPDSEVQATAKSVEKCRARWAANGWHTPRWLRKQALIGSKGGKVSKRGKVEGSNESVKPWEIEGISRAWWYRKKQRA